MYICTEHVLHITEYRNVMNLLTKLHCTCIQRTNQNKTYSGECRQGYMEIHKQTDCQTSGIRWIDRLTHGLIE